MVCQTRVRCTVKKWKKNTIHITHTYIIVLETGGVGSAGVRLEQKNTRDRFRSDYACTTPSCPGSVETPFERFFFFLTVRRR
jgi:hypothetical protein